jgi:hypothetical protein
VECAAKAAAAAMPLPPGNGEWLLTSSLAMSTASVLLSLPVENPPSESLLRFGQLRWLQQQFRHLQGMEGKHSLHLSSSLMSPFNDSPSKQPSWYSPLILTGDSFIGLAVPSMWMIWVRGKPIVVVVEMIAVPVPVAVLYTK